MSIKLYIDFCSQPCRALMILAKMNDIAIQPQIVSFVTGDTRSAWFKKVNPMGSVPVMDDNGFILTESVAILRYLTNKYKVATHWYPSDIHQRARIDEYIIWQYCPNGLRLRGAMVFIEKALKPHRTGQLANETDLKNAIKALEPVLDTMESYFLSRGNYIGGADDVTLADLLAVCELMQPISAGYDVSKERPNMKAWIERVKTRLQPHFDDTHKEIFALSAPYAQK